MSKPMTSFQKIVLGGIVAVLVFDTAASFASLVFGFPYPNATAGSILIYTTIGYLAFRAAGVAKSVGAVLLVEFVEVAVGWPISWLIGPGAPPPDQRTVLVISISIVVVFVFATVCGLLGAGIARVIHGQRQTNA
jgi:hypothetical protein